MSSISNFPRLHFHDIFPEPAAGPAAGVTVVTPNRRLAAELKRNFDQIQAAGGAIAWEAADILPISAFIERLYQEALYSGQVPGLPVLLTSAQEDILWEDVIRRSAAGAALLSIPDTAQLVREAWTLAHAWELVPRLGSCPLNEDGRAFLDWASLFKKKVRRMRGIDRGRLFDLASELCTHPGTRKPKRLVCYGFDILTPQQASFLETLAKTGCEVVTVQPPRREPQCVNVSRVACADQEDEIRHAAAWARARVEANGSARIGIVVPELSSRLDAVKRVFGSVMQPDVQQSLPGAARPVLPFNVSLGVPLTSCPIVRTAFLVLELGAMEVSFEQASALLRSPFIRGGETEMTARARLDARLRKRSDPAVTLEQLLVSVERECEGSDIACPLLLQSLSALVQFKRAWSTGRHPPSALAKAMTEALRAVGFPGERQLDSLEFQALKKWQETIGDFSVLDAVWPRAGYRAALSRLHRIAAETLFQPETPEVPIQILGVLEAAGMSFDHLWVIGLSDQAWPAQSRPNPFLPIELQRSSNLPQGSPAASLELARRLTHGWLCAADEVVLSHPKLGNTRESAALAASPLIAGIAARDPVLASYASHRDLIHGARQLERMEDARAPALDRLASSGIHGGAAVIKDHAACPFRALAIHRFRAEGIETPSTGLTAAERGTLAHHALAQVWNYLKTKRALDMINEQDLEAVLAHAAKSVIARLREHRPATLSGRFAEIEQRRLAKLVRAWLDEDRRRGDFRVAAVEDKRSIEIAGLVLTTRLDRVDEVSDGRRIIIDYKTGIPSASAMLGKRPDEPQLPLYLLGAEPGAAAVAFAQIKAGRARFLGFARDSDLLPEVQALSESRFAREHGSWEQLVAAWKADLARIATGFANGDARVDPKKNRQTCNNCDLRSFCRIDERYERMAAPRIEGEGGGE
ncbi:MAG TPA: PD-(D/E)XK nuclease family protein [Nitrosospira sp.]|nr:PD-(D/E)XK nuclease family protein [Nitrosospira sp.]